MEIILIGVNHKTAPVETRERLAIVDSRLNDRLASLVARPSLSEAVILSTCNRSEFYVAGSEAGAACQDVFEYLRLEHGVMQDEIADHHYHLENDAVARHLFTVSCGLDSMIPGEGQILSQVRKAFLLAQAQSTTGPVLNKLFPWAVKVGKRARSETRIAQGAASIGFAAVELAKRVCGDLTGRQVLIVGAGKMGELTLKLLMHSGVKSVVVVNRSFDRAQDLAQKVGGTAIEFEKFRDALVTADIVISSTGAPAHILARQDLQPVMRRRKNRPIFIIDIAMPRDIDPAAGELDNVYLYNVDDLQNLVASNVDERRREMAQVEAILGQELSDFSQFFYSLKVVPVIKRLRQSFDEVRQRELDAVFSRNSITSDEKKRLEQFSHQLLQKLLHGPTTRLKSMATDGHNLEALEALMEVFDLEEDPPKP